VRHRFNSSDPSARSPILGQHRFVTIEESVHLVKRAVRSPGFAKFTRDRLMSHELASEPIPPATHAFEIVVVGAEMLRTITAHFRCHVSPDGGLLVHASATAQLADHIS
jgi:hypothetical protein